MAKFTPIRITKNDRKEFNRLAKNARAKKRRLEKKFGENHLAQSGINLDKEMPVPKIGEFKTRKEFNAWKEKQKDFTNRANIDFQFEQNKYDVVASKRTLREYEKKSEAEIKRAIAEEKRVSETEIVVDGKKTTVGVRESHMKEGSLTGINIPEPFDFDEVRHKRRLDNIGKSMDRRLEPDHYDKRMLQMQDNFMTALSGSFNSEADEILDLIGHLTPHEFYNLWLNNQRDMEFAIYDSDGNEQTADSGHLHRMFERISEHLVGERNTDMDFL